MYTSVCECNKYIKKYTFHLPQSQFVGQILYKVQYVKMAHLYPLLVDIGGNMLVMNYHIISHKLSEIIVVYMCVQA